MVLASYLVKKAWQDHGGYTGHWWQANHKTPGATSSCVVEDLELLSAPQALGKDEGSLLGSFSVVPEAKEEEASGSYHQVTTWQPAAWMEQKRYTKCVSLVPWLNESSRPVRRATFYAKRAFRLGQTHGGRPNTDFI